MGKGGVSRWQETLGVDAQPGCKIRSGPLLGSKGGFGSPGTEAGGLEQRGGGT